MDYELFAALQAQYIKYLDEISKTTQNLMTFLEQNKDFRSMMDVALIVYAKSVDVKQSAALRTVLSTPDLQIFGGSREDLTAMCSDLQKLIDE
jgi:hypothetical protein